MEKMISMPTYGATQNRFNSLFRDDVNKNKSI
jgi:hypothetical protein